MCLPKGRIFLPWVLAVGIVVMRQLQAFPPFCLMCLIRKQHRKCLSLVPSHPLVPCIWVRLTTDRKAVQSVLCLASSQPAVRRTELTRKVQFSCSLMSDSSQPHELQYARLPCPSPTPGAYLNSCPLSRWCLSTISSSVIPFSSCLQSFPASGSFLMSQFFASGGWSIGVSALASVLPVNIQDWFPLGWTGWISLRSKSLKSSPTLLFKSINSLVLNFLYGWNLTSVYDYWKTLALTRLIFVGKVMSLLFNMLSKLVIAFLPRNKCLLICSDFGAPQNKVCHCFHCLPIYLPWSDGTGCHDFKVVFWMLSFKPIFSLSFFTFIKRHVSSSSLSAIRVVSSAFLRLLIFLPKLFLEYFWKVTWSVKPITANTSEI